MVKLSLGICIADEEYQSRFRAILLSQYKDRCNLFLFSSIDEISSGSMHLDGIILSGARADEIRDLLKQEQGLLVYLYDEENFETEFGEGVIFVDKYADVNQIMEEVLKRIGSEIHEIRELGRISEKTRCLGIYSLCDNELQLPFALTMASILGEHEKVLILDIQENSGFSQFGRPEGAVGLEELLLLIKTKTPVGERLKSAIGHMERADFIYPVRNSESLCEADGALYLELMEILVAETDYDVILTNFGPRFQGFFNLLDRCSEVFLMRKANGLGKWREYEFREEITRMGYQKLLDKMEQVEIPIISGPIYGFERLIEMWKWNEFGDQIRKMTLKGACLG